MTMHYRRIIVAVDGSQEAEYALCKAIEISKRMAFSRLYIVHVIDTRKLEVLDRSVYEHVQRQAEELLSRYLAKAEESGLSYVQTILEYGSPKNVITKKIADDVSADLIVCGARGHSVVERLLLGSVSGAIVRSAKCDVLVVRTPE